jgi:hypothetical protein
VSAARGAALVAAVTVAVVASGFLIGYPAEVAAATAIALAAVAAIVTTRDLALCARSRDRAASRADGPRQVDQLRRVGDALAAAQASELGVERELRPLLRPMAAMRLARRGVDLDRHLETARALLGDPLWEIVRVDRPSASNLVAGGISTGELDSMIERLERL